MHDTRLMSSVSVLCAFHSLPPAGTWTRVVLTWVRNSQFSALEQGTGSDQVMVLGSVHWWSVCSCRMSLRDSSSASSLNSGQEPEICTHIRIKSLNLFWYVQQTGRRNQIIKEFFCFIFILMHINNWLHWIPCCTFRIGYINWPLIQLLEW